MPPEEIVSDIPFFNLLQLWLLSFRVLYPHISSSRPWSCPSRTSLPSRGILGLGNEEAGVQKVLKHGVIPRPRAGSLTALLPIPLQKSRRLKHSHRGLPPTLPVGPAREETVDFLEQRKVHGKKNVGAALVREVGGMIAMLPRSRIPTRH